LRGYNTNLELTRIINLWTNWTCLRREDMIEQVEYIRQQILTDIHNLDLQERLLRFHINYWITFWVEKIGPDRLTLFGQRHRTTQCLRRLHRRLHATLSKHPSPLLFVSLVVSEVFKKDEASAAAVGSEKETSRAKTRAANKMR